VAVAAVAGGLGGCTTDPVPVAVAGLDRRGTPVVGGIDCTYSTEDLERIAVSFDDRIFGAESWVVSQPDVGGLGRPGGSTPSRDQPPEPDPRALDKVPLIAVGDPSVPGWVTEVALEEPVPELGEMDVRFEQEVEPTIDLTVALDGPADRFSASIDGDVVSGLTSAELRARIAETCDEAQSFAAGTFWAVAGGTTGAVLLLWVVAGVVAARQWRRAAPAVAGARAGTG